MHSGNSRRWHPLTQITLVTATLIWPGLPEELKIKDAAQFPLGLYRVTKPGMTPGLSPCFFLKVERYNRNGEK